jgi:hypothetical protein
MILLLDIGLFGTVTYSDNPDGLIDFWLFKLRDLVRLCYLQSGTLALVASSDVCLPVVSEWTYLKNVIRWVYCVTGLLR